MSPSYPSLTWALPQSGPWSKCPHPTYLLRLEPCPNLDLDLSVPILPIFSDLHLPQSEPWSKSHVLPIFSDLHPAPIWTLVQVSRSTDLLRLAPCPNLNPGLSLPFYLSPQACTLAWSGPRSMCPHLTYPLKFWTLPKPAPISSYFSILPISSDLSPATLWPGSPAWSSLWKFWAYSEPPCKHSQHTRTMTRGTEMGSQNTMLKLMS